MNRGLFLRKPHVEDFKAYLEFMTNRQKVDIHETVLVLLKGIHRKVYYLNLLVKNLTGSKGNICFLREVIVDLIICMDLFSMNYLKPVRTNLRSVIEEFNRYLLTTTTEQESPTTVFVLNNMIKNHFKEEVIKTKVSQLINDYKVLCEYVHVDVKNISDKLTLEDFHDLDLSELHKLSRQIYRIIENIIFIIIYLNQSEFISLNKHSQHYHLDQLNSVYKEQIEEELKSSSV